MVGKYKVVTLCGSTKFKEDFIKVQKELTLQGIIVISVGLFGHADGEFGTIITDEIFVINKNGYIGSSTRSEIKYAKEHGKKIGYLEPNYE